MKLPLPLPRCLLLFLVLSGPVAWADVAPPSAPATPRSPGEDLPAPTGPDRQSPVLIPFWIALGGMGLGVGLWYARRRSAQGRSGTLVPPP